MIYNDISKIIPDFSATHRWANFFHIDGDYPISDRIASRRCFNRSEGYFKITVKLAEATPILILSTRSLQVRQSVTRF